MLSKRARTVYVFAGLKLVRLAAFSARNARAMMPSKTKTPTRVSVLFFAMSDPILILDAASATSKTSLP